MPKSAADALIWILERNAYENGKALRALYRVVPDRFRCYHLERRQYKERSSTMSNTKPVQTGFAEINGTTLYYEVAGAGHPFVLVHGHLLDRRSWDEQFAIFAQRYRVIRDRKSTRLNSSHDQISYAVFCLKKKKKTDQEYIV